MAVEVFGATKICPPQKEMSSLISTAIEETKRMHMRITGRRTKLSDWHSTDKVEALQLISVKIWERSCTLGEKI